MSHHASVTVPAGEAELVLEALLSVYAARAGALAEHAERPDPGRLQEARDALTEAARALDGYGWERGPRYAPAQLAGPDALVGEVLRCALGDAYDALGSTTDDYHRGRAALPDVESAHGRLTAVLGLFAAFEREHAL
ncbi:MAG: hypothetical protein ACRDK0_08150 [Solirubrobacteraceae bacterium]